MSNQSNQVRVVPVQKKREMFIQVYEKYRSSIFNYIFYRVGDSEIADDLTSDVFVRLVDKYDEQSRNGRPIAPWLYAIATNKAIDSQRRNRRHRAASLDQMTSRHDDELGTLMDLLSNDDPDPMDVVELEESQNWVRDQISALPDHLRTVIGLVYFQGMKYREAADVLSIPVGTVKSRLHTAVLRLNEAWRADHIERN